MKAFVTGAAGLIRYNVANRLLADGHSVFRDDDMTSYYDVALKPALLSDRRGFNFPMVRLEDKEAMTAALAATEPKIVINVAAKAGALYALETRDTYVQTNVVGTFNLLELLKASPPHRQLVASSSSVYGGNPQSPSEETKRTDYSISLYAAIKKAGVAPYDSYMNLLGIPTTAIRVFTFYGPSGRPDIALFKLLRAILDDQSIENCGEGRAWRRFTYIDDIFDAVAALMAAVPYWAPVSAHDMLSQSAPFRTVNLASVRPVQALDYFNAIETVHGREARMTLSQMQPGNEVDTYASPELLRNSVGGVPQTSAREGVARLIECNRYIEKSHDT